MTFPTFVLTDILDVLDLRTGGRETALRFTSAETGAYFDMPISVEQLDQVLSAHAQLQDAPEPPAPDDPSPPPAEPAPPPSDQSLAGRGAVDMEPLDHEEEDPDMEADEDEPIVLRTPVFSRPAGTVEDEL